MEEVQELASLISSLDLKIKAAVAGSFIAGLFAMANLYLSTERQKVIVKLQQSLNDKSSLTEHLRKELSEKNNEYIKSVLESLTNIDHLADGVSTRVYKYYGDISKSQKTFEINVSQLWVNIKVLGYSGALNQESTIEICNSIADIRRVWARVLSELILNDEKYLNERHLGDNQQLNCMKKYSERDLLREVRALQEAVHLMSELIFKHITTVNSAKI